MIGGAQELILEQVWNQRFGQHSTPVGGGNAPIRCLLTANKNNEEEEEAAEEDGALKMAESEEEVDVLVQRVVKDIANAFKKNPSM